MVWQVDTGIQFCDWPVIPLANLGGINIRQRWPAQLQRSGAKQAGSHSPFALTWRRAPRQGIAADVYATMEDAHRALAQSTYPKLLFAGDPGALISPVV